jgi:hypothetical protein
MIVKYEVKVNEYVGIIFRKEFVIEPDHALISKVELLPGNEVKQEPGNLLIIFHLRKVVDERIFLPEVEEYLDLILDLISFEFGLSFGNRRKLGGAFISATAVIIKGFTEDQISTMEDVLSKNPTSGTFKHLYRAALSNTDHIARFMFLYSILFEVLNGGAKGNKGQATIDDYIRNHTEYDDKEDKNSTKYEEVKETLFTWLRNQVGHTTTNSEISYVRSTIERRVGDFSQIVKQAISERE